MDPGASSGTTPPPGSSDAPEGAAPLSPPVTCALCGFRFTPTRETMSCPSCMLHGHCQVTCCPHCGYEFVGESKLVGLLRRWWRGMRRASVRS